MLKFFLRLGKKIQTNFSLTLFVRPFKFHYHDDDDNWEVDFLFRFFKKTGHEKVETLFLISSSSLSPFFFWFVLMMIMIMINAYLVFYSGNFF